MKKIFTLIVSAALVLSGVLTSCDNDDDEPKVSDENTEVSTGDNSGNIDGNTDGNTDENTDGTDDGTGSTDDGTGSTEPADTTPSITWDANPDFEPYTIGVDDYDLKIVVNVPLGIESFTFSLNTDSTIVNIIMAALGITANTEYDLINDLDLVSVLMGLGIECGPSISGVTKLEFDATDLVTALAPYVSGITLTVTLTLKVADPEGQSDEKTLTFCFE